MIRTPASALTLLCLGLSGSATLAQTPGSSAPISDVRYEVRFDRASAAQRSLLVTMSFRPSAPGDVLLSLPAWTPGAYELRHFARNVADFSARSETAELDWDKVDADTWRVRPDGTDRVHVSFRYLADDLDNAAAWTAPDGAFFNGTTVLMYAEGRGFDFPATVHVRTEPDWAVATGMRRGPSGGYRESNYHDLVDMPFLLGAIDADSALVDGKWHVLAAYPRGAMNDHARRTFWQHVERITPAMASVWGEEPWDRYATLLVFVPEAPGLSALEHQNSHLGVYNPQAAGTPVLSYVTAHEMVHAWNVKRLRPAELWPYRYDEWQPTPLLWVSEGITDYYADLAMTRSGVGGVPYFLDAVSNKMAAVAGAPPIALEDASYSTWVKPRDGTAVIYYAKGALAGLMLDILIRDATDNTASLDVVMRDLYDRYYRQGRGFTTEDFWSAVQRATGGERFGDFHDRYVDGREPFPWQDVLPRAGLRSVVDTTRFARLGVGSEPDSGGMRVTHVAPATVAAEMGLLPGDVLLEVGEIRPRGFEWADDFRRIFGDREGDPLPIRLRRGNEILELEGVVRVATNVRTRVEFDPQVSERARRIRAGLVGEASPDASIQRHGAHRDR